MDYPKKPEPRGDRELLQRKDLGEINQGEMPWGKAPAPVRLARLEGL